MTEEQIEKLEERIFHRGIYFKRIPIKEWTWFKKWCDEEFESDYGFGLKWLVQGYMPPEK